MNYDLLLKTYQLLKDVMPAQLPIRVESLATFFHEQYDLWVECLVKDSPHQIKTMDPHPQTLFRNCGRVDVEQIWQSIQAIDRHIRTKTLYEDRVDGQFNLESLASSALLYLPSKNISAPDLKETPETLYSETAFRAREATFRHIWEKHSTHISGPIKVDHDGGTLEFQRTLLDAMSRWTFAVKEGYIGEKTLRGVSHDKIDEVLTAIGLPSYSYEAGYKVKNFNGLPNLLFEIVTARVWNQALAEEAGLMELPLQVTFELCRADAEKLFDELANKDYGSVSLALLGSPWYE